jgi:protoheme IX farnesyltransferase
MPTLVGLASPWYLMGAMTLGAVLMLLAVEFSSTRTIDAARRLFFGSILYLPLLWTILVLDHRLH